ncbi:unnamed protein product [Owenia fusiformis]|uniref:7-dehydrocholesterol reductase n=1 Tax=Owenia fusiformis TaxID=6347 RepID=A0A8J1UCI0_OWEFU|nr:unnamed protein product [Owenia fusiformis]
MFLKELPDYAFSLAEVTAEIFKRLVAVQVQQLIMQLRSRSVGSSDDKSAKVANGNGDSGATCTNGVAKNTIIAEPTTHILSWPEYVLYQIVTPLFLITCSPNFIILLWFTCTKCDGSFMKLYNDHFVKDGVVTTLVSIWSSISIINPFTLCLIYGYALFALLLQIMVPGPRAEGPVTPKGNVPVYKDNGFSCYVITMVTFAGLTYYLKQHGMSPTIVYDRFGEILGALNIFSLLICLVLYFKGKYMPSTEDNSTTGNPLFDYYWGTELYPRIFGVDVKVFTNCRFGMTVWPLLVCIFALKSYELHGFVDSMFVCTFLQMFYFTKFFWWEAGYMGTIDIMMDRAGFYICWGCLVYIAGLYGSVSLYMVNHPVQLGVGLTALLLTVGILSTIVNFWADMQKQQVRNSNGNCLIWGKKPDIIRAKYRIENGDVKESILLASGFWGISRHFHYNAEWLLAFAWSVPGLFENVMPYVYFIWLLILLSHRSFRDDTKCHNKYKQYWEQYRQKSSGSKEMVLQELKGSSPPNFP